MNDLLTDCRFEWWQTARHGHDGLISQLLTPNFYADQCELYFPSKGQKDTYGLNKGDTARKLNRETDGWWNTKTKRLLWSGGQWDPWRPCTVAADQRPYGPLPDTEEVPVKIIPGASHVPDFRYKSVAPNPAALAIFHEELDIMKKWIGEFYTEKGVKKPQGTSNN